MNPAPASRASHASQAAVYRRLLGLYPSGFRAQYADEMVHLFEDQLRDARAGGAPAGIVRTWLRTLGDLAVTAASEHARRDRTVAHSMTLAPSVGTRALGLAGILGGAVLLAAFVVDIAPELNVVRLVLFNLGAIAIAVAVHRRQASAARLLSPASAVPVIVANAWYIAMVVLSIGRPVYPDPEFRRVFFYAGMALWLTDAAFGIVALRIGAVSRWAALALAVGSLLGGSGMGGLAETVPWLSGIATLLAPFSLWGIALVGLGWILLGIDVAMRRRVGAPS